MKKNIVIIILSILVLGVGGYLAYDKVLEKEETNVNNKNEEEVIEKENYAIMARNYIDDVIDMWVSDPLYSLSSNGLDERMKLLMAISNVKRSSAVLCQNAFDIESNQLGYFDEPVSCRIDDNLSLFDYDLVNKEYKNLFGTSENAQKVDASGNMAYKYLNKLNGYVELSMSFSRGTSLYYYEIEEVDVVDNKLKITISYLTYHYSDLNALESYLDSYSYIIGDTTYREKTKDEVIKAYNENKKELPNLTFNYEKEDGRYILKSVE